MFTSISIIAVLAFLVTLGVVAYEIFLLRRKKHQAAPDKTVEIPDYKQDPQAVQELSSVPTTPGEPAVITGQTPQAQAAFEPRELPKSKLFFIIPVIVLLLIAGAGGYLYFRSKDSGDTVTDATDVEAPEDGTISPTAGVTIAVETEVSPSPDLSPEPSGSGTEIIIEGAEESGESSESGELEKGDVEESSESAELSVTPGEEASPTEMADKGGDIEDGLPEAGIINNTLMLGAIAIFFIGIAFIL